ncbi:ArfGap-domain-containing protein [Athelia psychrophila]|uniref:ArfGap-domain-containing protein n=1 Tax=Athelia psychrophila TaxID=1759441 RepID=A0A166T881_9AGAM|nr:ArfGap-domain-containing protein [Fibularhizoctonia sp. CBS 109695]
MSRQDKATTERNTKSLRELVKRPENKVCADCKRNDPRWASWNLGLYLCIRCSGIHRSMGTHISKVKSIDLDTWTPEQMQSIEKWGNRRANLYWEAHLKAGHVPPDHKMDSFIRSKYETRRWALDGPLPDDPSVLDDTASSDSAPAPAPAPTQATTSATINRATASATPPVNRQPQPHQLLSTAIADQRRQVPALTPPTGSPAPAVPAAPAPAPKAPDNDLFSLDFHAPPPSTSPSQQLAQSKNVKQDILSLFSTPAAAPAAAAINNSGNNNNNAFGSFQSADPWGTPAQPQQPTSMMGATGWGASAGWSAPAPAAPAQANLWGTPAAPQPDMFGANNDIWGANPGAAAGGANIWGAGGATQQQPQQKKDDAFGDIWGGFK